MELSEVIIAKIKNEGPIPFNDFMEMSLYYPGMGYYASAQESIGTNGDFYTSPCLSPVFGAMVSKQIEEMWTLMGKTDFTIVEFGAGKGSLCAHIMQYIEYTNPQLYEKLNYAIIEKSPAMRQHEQESISRDKVCWYDGMQD
ncbi:MAG TPA: SAM-dependent methyltransferase, partial [Flavipsychrobacter sp.]